MKQITVATMTTKDGTNNHGPWVNHRIKDTDGNDWTTFADEDKTITQGAVLEVEPKMKDGVPVMKDNRMRFDKFTIMAAGAPTPAPGHSPSTNGDDPAKRLSIERQSSAATILTYSAALMAAGLEPAVSGHRLLEEESATKALTWLSSRFDDVPNTGSTAPTQEELQRALSQTKDGSDTRTQADKDFDELESAGSGLDVDWAVRAAGKLGWKTTTTLHSWLKSQGLAPVPGESIEDIFANIPGDKIELIRSAIETRLKEKGG